MVGRARKRKKKRKKLRALTIRFKNFRKSYKSLNNHLI